MSSACPRRSVCSQAGTGSERNPSFNPDGTQVVYEWERENGEHHLYLKVIGSGDPIPLTAGPGSEYGPAWSRDGKWIAFLRQQQDSAGIYVIAPVGGTARKVADVPPFSFGLLRKPYRRLDWTADSRHIIVGAFGRPPGMESLLLISVDTGEKTWLTGPPADTMSGDREPAVSPDGTKVAFARGAMGAETLYILQLGAGLQPAGAPRPVPGAGPARSPAWLPDGRQLIFTTLKPGMIDGFALSWIDLDSGKPPRPLLSLGSNAAMPAVSRQGRLAYSIAEVEGIVWRQDIQGNGETPPPPVKVNAAAAFQMGAQYSPDGARIAFISGRSGTREIWNCASDGLHCIQVTSLERSSTEYPRWSPDGKRLLFESMAEGDWGAYMVDATGGAPRLLNREKPHGGTPYWSHDGRWIYYSSRDTGARQIWRIPAEGGKAVLITRNGGYMPVDSPDSKTLYYLKEGRGTEDLFRSAADGSGETELVRGIAYVWLRRRRRPNLLPSQAGHRPNRDSGIPPCNRLGLARGDDRQADHWGPGAFAGRQVAPIFGIAGARKLDARRQSPLATCFSNFGRRSSLTLAATECGSASIIPFLGNCNPFEYPQPVPCTPPTRGGACRNRIVHGASRERIMHHPETIPRPPITP